MSEELNRGRIFYIGSFPPPYGGVTVKNALLFKWMSKRLLIRKINLSQVKALDMREGTSLAYALLSRGGSVVIGMSRGWLSRSTTFLYRFNREKMARSVVFVMGGALPEGKEIGLRLSCYRKVYVETEEMRRIFETAGVTNCAVYPNCRERQSTHAHKKSIGTGVLRCVYFSLIAEIKGAGILLSAASALPKIQFHFYGHIDSTFEKEFLKRVASLDNAIYHGVFDSANGDAITELAKYDVHALPTLAPNEGVPGVIVETKVAGIPTVATDRGYNATLVQDGIDGFILGDGSIEEFINCFSAIDKDRALLARMQRAALDSAECYYIDRHIDSILHEISRSE